MHTGKHILFWVLVGFFLILGFGSTFNNFGKTFYFVCFLMPVAIGTSYFFNYYLVPRFLFRNAVFRFWLYTAYALVVSFFLQLVVILLAFVLIANYNYTALDPLMANIFVLASVIYLVVFLKAFLLLYLRVKQGELRLNTLHRENESLQTSFITVRENRENRQLKVAEIIFMESMGDYVKITTTGARVTTKETLSGLERELPDYFIRIHRSFLVNRHYVKSYSATSVSLNDAELPVSRTYKAHALAALSK